MNVREFIKRKKVQHRLLCHSADYQIQNYIIYIA